MRLPEIPCREAVYGHLKLLLTRGELKPGTFLDLKALGENLGLSRTPLRDALLRLECEGFVTIHSRRGVLVNALDFAAIRDLYQILGALEGAAALETGTDLGDEAVSRMSELNASMIAAVKAGDFEAYYRDNLAFHDVYLSLSRNEDLRRAVRIYKERLYDFPRPPEWISEWEERSTGEHAALISLFASGDAEGAARHLRDVHWSFQVQEPYILRYYSSSGGRRVG